MSITSSPFGKLLFGERATCYRLDNQNGLVAEILDYGGIIKNLYVKDKNNQMTDVVLGKATLADYGENPNFMGGIIGRCANIIKDAKIKIGRKTYALKKNFGNHSLNGGAFHQKLWNAKINDDPKEPSIILYMTSPEKEGGFPGEVTVMVTYTLTQDNSLRIEYTAATSSDTIVNITNHSYFNLSGTSSYITEHKLQLNSSFYIKSVDCLPTGEILTVDGTDFDYRTEKKLEIPDFFDQCFISDGKNIRKIANLYSEDSGINMEVFSDNPVLHLKTLRNDDTGKGQVKYRNSSGIAIMPELFPDALSFNHFPTTILEKGKNYKYLTEYKFSIR